MKKLLFLLFLLPYFGISQNYIPTKYVYDFDVGDEFHYHYIIRDWGSTTNNGYYLNKVINKSVSGNQVTYTFSSKGYHLTTTTYSYSSFNRTFNKTYSLVDTVRDTIPPCIDSTHPYFYPYSTSFRCWLLDTLYFDTTFNQLNYEITNMSFEYFGKTNYVKGLGMVYDDDNSYATPPVQYIRKLIYYKKDSSGLSWGNALSPDVGINEIKNINFKTFPNPVISNLNLSFYGNITSYKYEMINTMGQIVQSGRLKSNQIDCSSLTPGIYFLRIINEDGDSGVKRVVISK